MEGMSEKPAGAPPMLLSALKFGAACGAAGLFVGGTAGIIRSKTPILFSIASGSQCFALGFTYMSVRKLAISQRDKPTRNDYAVASTIAGGCSGAAVALMFRGPANVIPGTIMWSLFGFLGQKGYDAVDASRTEAAAAPPRENIFKRMANSKWTPVRSLSDEEYASMLKEKLFKVDVEIALIDDRLKNLEEETKQKKGEVAMSTPEDQK
ncbi:hypothetical protein K402DRAFT_195335 [Aulographum hederae CBS 113979]|uniref:Uncharacterized protein n=1 Tax=Aulographum hederae CBS 113979 TaxID=1176131 RepID=A0A6G1GNY4_9PEZI|nr:hypothetical protein K402DRAFT_195335 [Aulographum hederae CBS 113979]